MMACPQNDSWEEKWGEHYTANGAANKYADKWGKDGPNVWHERWGEDYDGGGGCVKYTDKVNLALPLPSACTCCIAAFQASYVMHLQFPGKQGKQNALDAC